MKLIPLGPLNPGILEPFSPTKLEKNQIYNGKRQGFNGESDFTNPVGKDSFAASN
jgi:hypothetical protein